MVAGAWRARSARAVRILSYFLSRSPGDIVEYGRWRIRKVAGLTRLRGVDDAALLSALVGLNGPATGTGRADAADYFRRRSTPRFRITEAERDQVVAATGPERTALLSAADDIVAHRFEFRGVSLTFGGRVDWFACPGGDRDWRWDLNRHAYFETLGRAYWLSNDERYADECIELLLDWTAANPVDRSENWSNPFEVAIRLGNWIAAFFYMRRSSRFADDAVCLGLLKGLLLHGRILASTLERHVPNNHLLLEAKALAMAGLLFPEFSDARAWFDTGLRYVKRQVRAQVCVDGGHAERSMLYHRLIASELLELLVLFDRNNVDVPADLEAAAAAMIAFERAMRKPDGSFPLFSDAARSDTAIRFSAASSGPVFLAGRPGAAWPELPSEAGDPWLVGPAASTRAEGHGAPTGEPSDSRAFADTGYAVVRGAGPLGASYLALDCGPFGHRPLPTHGHADALAFELYASGRTWLTDAGGYSLGRGVEWRNFFRGTAAHNTVLVDGRDQSELLDVRRVHRPATGRLDGWAVADPVVFADAWHDGYLRMPRPVHHRRQVLAVAGEYWVIVDQLTGPGSHVAEALFHFMPDVDVRIDPRTASAIATAGRRALSLIVGETEWHPTVVEGSELPVQGWVALDWGVRERAPVVSYRREGPLPARLCTLLWPGSDDIKLEVRTHNDSPSAAALELLVTGADFRDSIRVVAPQAMAGRSQPARYVGFKRDGRADKAVRQMRIDVQRPPVHVARRTPARPPG